MMSFPYRALAGLRAGVPLIGLACAALVFGCSGDDQGRGRSENGVRSNAGAGGVAGAGGTGDRGTAGSSGFGNSSSAGTGAGVAGMAAAPGGGTAGIPNTTCAQGNATATPVTPVVWLVVDGSSSMNQPFDGAATRWQTLRETLMAPTGVVATLERTAQFGLVIYSGGNTDPAQCVRLVTVEPALNNYAAIAAAYPADPIGMGTPTDRALDHVVTNLPVIAEPTLDTRTDPVYVVLATDGQPNDSCGTLFGGAGSAAVRQRVIDVVTRGTDAGMQMFVISLAGGDRDLQQHLEQVAMATASQTPPFVPATQAELIATFQEIIGGASCQVMLDGTVTAGQECAGTVTLNGAPLACGSENGFMLADPRTIQLTGNACTSFVSMESMVHATFPCEAFSPD